MKLKRITRWMLLTIVASMATVAIATVAIAKPPVNTDKSGVAIKGYDTVAYFTEGAPVKGKSEFTFEWNGAKWRFSSKRNMEMFAAKPEKYAPQYGGY